MTGVPGVYVEGVYMEGCTWRGVLLLLARPGPSCLSLARPACPWPVLSLTARPVSDVSDFSDFSAFLSFADLSARTASNKVPKSVVY